MDTVIVEGQRAGGTCLIRGCIPSKALIHAAHTFHKLAGHAKKGGHMGISIPGPAELKMEDTIAWKDGIVDRLNKGVEALLKNAGVELVNGWAEFQDAKTVKVGKGKDALIIQAEDGIRDYYASRGLGDVYKRQIPMWPPFLACPASLWKVWAA